MRILIEAHHPAHIHFWKYTVRRLRAEGHDVLVVGRDRDVMRKLSAAYDWMEVVVPPASKRSNRVPMLDMLRRQWLISSAIRKFKPDTVASLMGSYTQSAKLFGCRSLIFTDSEFQRFNHRIAHPFASEIHTPACLNIDFGSKHFRYNGFHELAYLGAKYYDIEKSFVPECLEVEPGEYVVMRLCAWDTFHDIGNGGMAVEGLRKAIALVEQRYKVFIQPEGGRLPPELERYRLSIPPETYHDVLCHARFVVTEGFTTASEALVLGVPSIVINRLACDTLRYQNANYKLLEHYRDPGPAIDAIERLVDAPLDVSECRELGRRYQMDHCDMVDYAFEQLMKV